MTEWYCTFHYPPNWVEVLHQPAHETLTNGDGAAVAERVLLAVERSFAEQADEERQQLVEVITPLMVEDAERHAAVSAHGCAEDPQGVPLHMHLTMWVSERSHPDSLDEELRLLADAAREAGTNLEAPTVSEVTLPAGRAVRVQQVDRIAAGSGMATVETVDYWLPVDGSGDVLWIHFWTPSLAFAQTAVDVFDQMARAVVLES